MLAFRFTKAQHLRRKSDFDRVYALKCKAADGLVLVFAAINHGPCTRIGLSVGKKHGGAVTRYRLKRLLREAFRLQQHQIPANLDLIVIPLASENASLAAFQNSLVNVTRRLMRRIELSNRDKPTAANHEAPP